MLSYLFGKGGDQKPINENEDPELAMRDAMDSHGDFTCKLDGSLEFEDFLVFRAIVMRQASRKFEPRRADLNERKMKAFQSKDN